jgi:CDP-diacylglycerol--serine O-phosphatidyltransferase
MDRNFRAIIPNFITAMNMFFGFVAILYAIEGQYESSVWFIYLATFLDLLDGRLARALNAGTKFGIEFDSFSDLVTFGVAPSVLVYLTFFDGWKPWGLAIAFLPMVFAAMRLGRFNVEWGRTDKRYMKGVATPMSAMFLIGYVAFSSEVWGDYAYRGLSALLVIAISILMVSTIRYESNSVSSLRNPAESWKIIPFALSILSVIAFGAPAIFIWSAFYVMLGLSRWAFEHRPRREPAELSA